MFKLISLKNRITSLKFIQQRFQCFSIEDSPENKNKNQDNSDTHTGSNLKEESNDTKDDQFQAIFYSKKQKNRKRDLLKKEITTNPEFFNAFPHLRDKAFPNKEEEQSFLSNDNKIQVNQASSKSNYFESLKRKYENFESKEEEEKIQENEARFVEAYSRREGPKKYMSREEKERVHNQIDEKMRELENTGLSREEILLNKPVKIILK